MMVVMMVMVAVWDYRECSDRQCGDQERLADRSYKGLHGSSVWAAA